MVLKRAMELFGSRADPAPAPRKRRHADPAQQLSGNEPSPADPDLSALENALTKISQGRTELVTGRVQLLKFDRLRKRFGSKWDRLADRVLMIIQMAIGRRLADDDVFIRHGDLGFIILFASLSQEQAELKCALIADEVAKRLFGSDVTSDDFEIRTATTTVDGRIALQRADNLEDLLAEMAAQLDKTDVEFVTDPQTEVEDGSGIDNEQTEMSALAYRERTPFKASDLDYVFQPVWDVSLKALSTYGCMPARRENARILALGEAAIPNDLLPLEMLELDRAVLRTAVSELMLALDLQRKCLISIPIHYSTLGSAQRRQLYLSECRDLDDSGRTLLLFEIVGLPDGVPQSRLMELSVSLRPFSRAVLARCLVDENDFQKYKAAGITAVGFDASAGAYSEAGLMKEMEKFVERAEKHGLQTYLLGASTLSLNAAAIATGVTYLTGPAVTSVTDQPKNAVRFNLNDLFGIPT